MVFTHDDRFADVVVRTSPDDHIENPWDASRHLFKALTGEIIFIKERIIGRNTWNIQRASRVLARERRLQENTHPLDSELEEDDDLFGFPFDEDDD